MLSALCGSNFLPHYILTEFLGGLTQSNDDSKKRGKIVNVAAYVKRQEFELVNKKPKYDLNQISRDVFGADFTLEQLNSIANGLECYNLNFEEVMSRTGYRDPAQRNSFLKFCKTHDSFMFKLATDAIFIVKDITYIDYRNYKSKNFAELVIPILMKVCGILYKDNPRRPVVRKICMKHAHDEPSKLTEETIIYPPSKQQIFIRDEFLLSRLVLFHFSATAPIIRFDFQK